MPIPPPYLRELVAGNRDLGWFLASGARGAQCIQEALSRHGVELAATRSILDFGCGCGRVTRYWAGLTARVHGVDRNPRLVAWCRRHLPFATFKVNPLRPPLAYPDGEFELVYALSVFTHLPEELQRPWLRELRRVTASGGYVILSLQGDSYREALTLGEKNLFDRGQLVVRVPEAAGRNVCAVYHPTQYVERMAEEGLRLMDQQARGATGNPYQDLVLFRRA